MKLLLVLLVSFISFTSASIEDNLNEKIDAVPKQVVKFLNQHINEFKNFSLVKNVSKSDDVTSIREVDMKLKNFGFSIEPSTIKNLFYGDEARIDFTLLVYGVYAEGSLKGFEENNFNYDGFASCIPKVFKINLTILYNGKNDHQVNPFYIHGDSFKFYRTDVIINCLDHRYKVCIAVKKDIEDMIEDQLPRSIVNKVKTLLLAHKKDISQMIASA